MFCETFSGKYTFTQMSVSRSKMFKGDVNITKEYIGKRLSLRKRKSFESNENDLLKTFVDTWNFRLNHPRMEVMSSTTAVGNGYTIVCIAELENGEIHLRTFKKVKDEFISGADFENL